MARRLAAVAVLAAAAVAAAAAAWPGPRPQKRVAPCDPVGPPEYCLFPFPNAFYLAADPATPTGMRLVYPQEAMPVDRHGETFSPASWERLDGMPTTTSIMAYFANVSLEASRAPGWQHFARSLEDDCPTVLLDTATGERLPHFAELDYSTETTDRRAFIVWPTRKLDYSRRYIVAMRNLRDAAGTPLPPSEGFRAFRDGIPTSDPDIENRRDLYEDIFAQLEAAGVARSELQLAWEFSTGSLEYATNWIVRMRDDATSRLPGGSPTFRVTNVSDNVSDHIFREVLGEMEVPYYATDSALPGSKLIIDESNDPVYQGLVTVPFVVYIPHSCANGTHTPCPIVNYGHGIFSSRFEAGTQSKPAVANTYGYILASVDLWGMSNEDMANILQILRGNLSDFASIPDRTHQGVLNHLVLTKLMRGAFIDHPAATVNGTVVIDPSRAYYWGISLGGVLVRLKCLAQSGLTAQLMHGPASYSLCTTAGNPFALMFPRAADFDEYYIIIKARFLDAFDRLVLQSLFGQIWERGEGGGYLSSMSGPYRLPGVSFDKRIYIDYGLGDAQISYLTTYYTARSIGAQMFENNVACPGESAPIFGIPVVPSRIASGSVAVGIDYQVGCGPVINRPPSKETDAHALPQTEPRNQAMSAQFLATGVVDDLCLGQGCYTTFPR